jgi:type II secretory pathway pseudopilin PulG
MRRSRGFSLVELMIAALLTAVVVMFLMQTFTTQQRSYVVLDQTVEMQQNSRAISDLLEHDARQAGMLGPRGAAACGTDGTTGPDSLYLADSDVIDVSSMSSKLPRYYAKVGGYGGQGQQALTLKAGASLSPDGKPSVDNDGDGVADTDFRVKGGVILMDVHDPTVGVDCGTVVSITPPNQIVVKFENGLNIPPADADYVAIMPAHVYSVDVAKRQLTRDGMVLANDVEDLQVAYFFDVNENHAMDGAATEYPGSAGNGVPQYQSNVWGRDDLREIRMNVVVRTRTEVPGSSSGLFQNTENRQAVATADGYRRRVFTSTVKLRNSAYETATYPE